MKKRGLKPERVKILFQSYQNMTLINDNYASPGKFSIKVSEINRL